MNNNNMDTGKLDRYALLWSLLRMVIASVSLFFGAMPIAYRLMSSGAVSSLLSLSWLISGVASLYLLYRWFKSGKKVFGGSDKKDMIAFLVMVTTGLNLGYAITGTNIGMSFIWGSMMADIVFKATAVVYLVTAVYVWKRWKASGESLFGEDDVSGRGSSNT